MFNEWVYKEAKNSETDKRRKMLQEDINKLVRKKILSIDSNGVFHLSLDVPITRRIKNDILLRTIYKIRAKKGSLLQQIRVRDRSGCSERRHVSTGKTKDKYDKVHAVKNAFH